MLRSDFINTVAIAWHRRARSQVILASTCIVLVALYPIYLLSRLNESSGAVGHPIGSKLVCPGHSSNRPYIPPLHVTQSRWKQLSIRYPPEELLQLHSERPRRLRRVQHTFQHPHVASETQRQRQKAVRSTFERGWSSYKQKAWLKDELLPISGKSNNNFGGWGATLVDTLDTLWILDMTNEFYEAINASLTINFTDSSRIHDGQISVFETTIRFLGGFLSAYELPGCKDSRILDKAIEVADMLYHAFDTPKRIPIPRWNPKAALDGAEQNGPSEGTFASFGSLCMEFTRLSQLTGDMRYYDAVQRLTNILEAQQFTTKLPGMWPIRYDWANVNFNGNSFGLGASADSSYEYLLKMYPLLGGTSQATQYERLYKTAIGTAIQHVLFQPMSQEKTDVLIPGKLEIKGESSILVTENEHLTCFLGGTVGLGGKLFANASHITTADKLARGCVWAYGTTPTGIMPENGVVAKCLTPDCDWDEEAWKQQGGGSFYPRPYTGLRDGRYILRPEAVESLFYLYRITGDTKYQDMAWNMFQTIDEHTKTQYGNAELTNVLHSPPAKQDAMQSFWMAEVIKYMYLIFSDPALISLDDFVFNTEAHPFRIPKE